MLLELSPSAYVTLGKLELLLPLEDLFLDLLFLLDLTPPLSGQSGGVEDDEAAAFTAAFEQSNGWWVVIFGDVADSIVFEELLGCTGVVGQCQIRPEVVPMIAVLFFDEWNDSHAENHDVDVVVVHGIASQAKFPIGSL